MAKKTKKQTVSIPKLSFDDLNSIYETLLLVFTNNGEDELDDRFTCLWANTLFVSGWTEEEFLEEIEEHTDLCPNCQEEHVLTEEDEKDLEFPNLSEKNSEEDKNKLN